MLLQGGIVAGLVAILVIEVRKKSKNSNQGGEGAGSSAECDNWRNFKKEYEDCVQAKGGANPCSYGIYGRSGGPPPPPKDCKCNPGQ